MPRTKSWLTKRHDYCQRDFKNWLRCTLIGVKTARARKGRSNGETPLTIDQIMDLLIKQDYKCAVTGLRMTHKLRDLFAASIDRIDSAKGYVAGNVQLVCKAINLAKSAHSNDEILDFVTAVRYQSAE